MTQLHRFGKWAHILEWTTSISLVAIPSAIVISLATSPITPAVLDQRLETLVVSPSATKAQMYAAIGLNLIPAIILLFTLNSMRQLFASYRRGEVFTDACARLIQSIGRGFMGLALMPFLLHPILTGLLSMANPPGQRSISVNLSSDMVFFALSGGLIIVIGWAMRQASELASENRAFV